MSTEIITDWAVDLGMKVDAISAYKFEKGVGIIAMRDLEENEILLSVPYSCLRTAENVSNTVRSKFTGSVNRLLAADLAADESTRYKEWRARLPSIDTLRDSIPLMWPHKLQKLLPQACLSLVMKQKSKIDHDWGIASPILDNMSHGQFLYYWFIVSTRTFYYTSPDPNVQVPIDSDDRLAVIPFADYFNHADTGCTVTYSESSFEISSHRYIQKGKEIFVSYGNHSNDFLLAEYGFILERNRWDEVGLDEYILRLFSTQEKEDLRRLSYLGRYVLDENSVCHRTQVALRRLSMPLEDWQEWIKIAPEGNDASESATEDILSTVFKSFLHLVQKRLQEIAVLDPAFEHQRNLLRKFWEQIGQLLHKGVARLSI